MRALLTRVIFSFIMTALVFGVLEVGLRLVGEPPQEVKGEGPKAFPGTLPDHYLPDRRLGWKQKPGILIEDPVYQDWARQWGLPLRPEGEVVTNSRGLRDDEPVLPRPDHQVRVMCLGDSSVFGVGAPRVTTFAEVLERELVPGWSGDPAARPLDVYNGGVSGYSSFQSVLQLEENLDLGLDVVIVYNQNSEMMTAIGTPDSEFYRSWGVGVDPSPLRGLSLYRWLAWGTLKLKAPAPTSTEARLRVRVEDYQANLRRIVALGRAREFGVIFVIPPVTSDLAHPEPPEIYRVASDASAARMRAELDRVEALTEWWGQERRHFRMAMSWVGWQEGVTVVDGPGLFMDAYLGDFEAYSGANALFVDELHPSAAGHHLLGQALKAPLEALLKKLGRQPGGGAPPAP